MHIDRRALLLALLIPLCATAQTPAPSAVQAIASRTGGVAPLMVFFDTVGSDQDEAASQSFHQLDYRWDFGDGTAGVWRHGSLGNSVSKNIAAGPLAAHVYERPGTYVATLQIRDASTVSSRRVTITVSDPDTVFAGSSTICFSTGVRGFSGCPPQARQVRTSDFGLAIGTYKAPGRRLLFRRGETFRSALPAVIDMDGPGLVGAFGPSADRPPVLQSLTGTATIQLSNILTPGIGDWRIMDLDLLGNASPSSAAISLGGGIRQVTLLRLNSRKQRLAIIGEALALDHYNLGGRSAGHRIWDQIALVDSNVAQVNHSALPGGKGLGTYFYGERVFIAGNAINNAGTSVDDVSHVIRFPYLAKGIISRNTLAGAGPSAHLIKIHAPAWGSSGVAAKGVGKGYSRWILISDNKFVGSGSAWLVTVGPQNNTSDERVRDVISERNWIVGGEGMQAGQVFWAQDVSVRNNITDSSGGSRWQTGLLRFARRGIEPAPGGLRIYNESFYTRKAIAGGQFVAIALEPSANGVVARNNVAYAPNASNPLMFANACGACLTASHNSSDSQVKTSLPFRSPTPTSPSSYRAAGYALAGGTPVPLWADFYLKPPRTPRDMGAVTH